MGLSQMVRKSLLNFNIGCNHDLYTNENQMSFETLQWSNTSQVQVARVMDTHEIFIKDNQSILKV